MRKTWKKIVSVLMALTFVVLGLPVFDTPVKSAKAAEAVTYIDENKVEQTITNYELLNDQNHPTTWSGGNYVVGSGSYNNTITYANNNNQRVTVSGNVVLVIPEGRTLYIPKGICVPDKASLKIYGKGTLAIATPSGGTNVSNNNAAIGGNNGGASGSITIVDATLRVRGGQNAAGIGGGNGGNGGTISIYNATVSARGGQNAAGIGGGQNGSGGTITIYSGAVSGRGGNNGAGIGGGQNGNGGTITIKDGEVLAKSDNNGAGIGGGSKGYGGTIEINGGEITAEGGSYGAGIGGGSGEATDKTQKITITNGTVSATGHGNGSGIGSGSEQSSCGTIVISGGEVTAEAGHGRNTWNGREDCPAGIGGSFATGDSITISGGTVTANAEYYGTGIGAGQDSNGARVIITGGKITATSEDGTGIGNGYESTAESSASVSISITDNSSFVKSDYYYGKVELVKPVNIQGSNNTLPAGVLSSNGDINGKTLVKGTTYTITWKDGNGDVLSEEEYYAGATPAYSGETTPTKNQTDKYTYAFNGTWSPEITAVAGSATYTAQFDETVREYTITWKDGDNKVLKTEDVAYDETPVYSGDTPTKTADGQYTYSFNNTWSPAIEAVNGPATYTAQFNSTVNQYTITWKNGDDEIIKTDTLDYGATPSYTGETPTKKATAQYSYEFNNTWSPAIENVTGDATYVAQFNSTVNQYTVTWVDGNGATLKTDTLDYGTTPSYTGETPTKDATDKYSFEFNNTWSPAITEVKGNQTYTAQFDSTVNQYDITWVDGNGATLKTDTLDYGATPSYTGETPTKDATDKYSFEFNNTWSPAITEVKGNQTYTAQFDSTINQYDITWVDGNGDKLKTDTLDYGVTPSYSGETPTKDGTDAVSYTFKGTWTPAIIPVAGPATYTAEFTESTNAYTVTWIVDGTTTTTNVEYGYPAVYGSTPTKADEGDVTFEFAGWQVTGGETVYGATEQLPNVTGPDVSYTALFTAYYPITFGEIIEGSMIVEGYDPDDPRAAEGALITLTLTPTEGYQYHDGSIKVMCGNTEVENVGNPHDNQFEFTMPAGSVEVTAACERFYNVWVNGEPISTLTASNVLHDSGTPRITYEETDEKMVLSIHTKDDIVFNSFQSGAMISVDDGVDEQNGRPFEIVAEEGEFSFVGNDASYGILSSFSDVIIIGKAKITSNSKEFSGIYSGERAVAIEGGLTVINPESDPTDDVYGFAVYAGGSVSIVGDISISGFGSCGITAAGNVKIIDSDLVIDGYKTGISASGDISISAKDEPITISTVYSAISAGLEGDITIKGDLSVSNEDENAINAGGSFYADGNVSLDLKGNHNGIVAAGIEITGDFVGQAPDNNEEEPSGAMLYSFCDITIGGSVRIDNPAGWLIMIYTEYITDNTSNGDVLIKGDIKGLEDDQPAVGRLGITAFNGNLTVEGNVSIKSTSALGGTPITANKLTVDGDLDIDCVGDAIFASDVVLGGNVTIVSASEEFATGIYSFGSITMKKGIWDIQVKEGNALSAGTGITILDTHGISVPENGEIGLYEDAECYTVVIDGMGGYNNVRIEPFIPVTFVNDDGTKLQTVKGYPGQSPKYTGEKPTKASTAEKVYTFKGWKDAAGEYGKDEDLPEIADGSDALTYTAVFEEATEVYTITFVNEDGTELQSGKVAYGETPKYDGATPTKASDDKYDYTFESWTPSIAAVTGDATYTAKFKATEIKKDPVKGVYKYVSEGAPKYTKGSKKSVVITFKRTENDEITFDMFKGVKTAKGELISGKHYTAKKGSVEITLLPEYLETLEVGKTAVTVSFEDGDPVTIELEVVAAQQQTDTNPATGDQMNYIWIFFVIGAAALAIVLFAQVQRRRREEEI